MNVIFIGWGKAYKRGDHGLKINVDMLRAPTVAAATPPLNVTPSDPRSVPCALVNAVADVAVNPVAATLMAALDAPLLIT